MTSLVFTGKIQPGSGMSGSWRMTSCFANSVIDQEAQTLLYSAIEELPEKARIVFEMSFMEGLKNVEIAEKLGLSDSSVKKYKATALDFLRKKLDPSFFISYFQGYRNYSEKTSIFYCPFLTGVAL